MGNAPSAHPGQAGSIRSRSSRRSRIGGADDSRVSQAISFYQTPPGSFDLGRRPLSDASTEIPDYGNFNGGAAVEESEEEPAHPAQEPKKWRPSVYSLVNMQSGTGLDLSGADDRSLIGFPLHNGKNQQVRSSTLFPVSCIHICTVALRAFRRRLHDPQCFFSAISDD